MADEKKAVNTSKASKGEDKGQKAPRKFSPKNIGKGIAHFFKDLRGETKKIVWPGRQMVLKSTGVVLAAIIIIGAGIWVIDYAISGGITALNKAANTTEITTEAETEAADEHDHAEDDSQEKSEEKTDESTTEA